MKRILLIFFHTLLIGSTAFGASFTALGDLDGGTYGSFANGISADGSTVVGSSYSASGTEAFKWTVDGGIVGLGDLPGGDFTSVAQDVSADGSVIVGYSLAGTSPAAGYKMFSYSNDTMSTLSGYWGFAFGVSDDGNVITGQWHHSGFGEAFRYDNGNMQGMYNQPGPNGNYANGISGDGSVIVGSSYYAALRYANGQNIDIGNLYGACQFCNSAQSASYDGSVIVGYSGPTSNREAFRWTSSDGMIGIGDLAGGSFSSFAYDVSADGSVIVGNGNTNNGNEAFFWTENFGLVNLQDYLENTGGLDLTGWQLTSARGISADGSTIAGIGINPIGNTEAFIANINVVPEPISSTLFIVGGATLGFRRFWNRRNS